MRPSSTRESNAQKTSVKSNLSPFDKSKARSLTPPSYGISAADNPQPLQAKFGNSFGRSGTLKRKGETGLPTQLKARMEQMGGVDLSDVKVNYNSSKPQQIGALAYTRGNQIEIGPGQERHLAHEAWHAVQQKQGRVTPTTTLGKGLPVNNDATLEKEADVMGARALSGGMAHINGTKNQIPISTSHQPTLQLKKKGGIQKKKTRTAGDVWVYVVEKGDYPIKIANEAYMNILKLAMLQHPSIIKYLGLEQKGHIDYTALVGVSAKDRDNDFWIKGFLKKWLIHPGDELLLERVSGPDLDWTAYMTEDEVEEYKRIEKANQFQQWLRRNYSPDNAERIFNSLGVTSKGKSKLLDKLILNIKTNPTGTKKLLYPIGLGHPDGKKDWPLGAKDPAHPIHHKAKGSFGGLVYQKSKKFPGLYVQPGPDGDDERYFYYASPSGIGRVDHTEIVDGSWKKYQKYGEWGIQ